MRLIQPLGNGICIHRPHRFHQLLGRKDGPRHLAPIHGANGVDVLLGDLIVGDAHRLVRPSIRQVSQMHQQSQHIVTSGKGGHVIRKGAGVDFNPLSCQHLDHGVLETVHVHLDVDLEGFVGFGLVPVGVVGVAEHRVHHGLRAIHIVYCLAVCALRRKFIAIVPCPCFLEAHAILLA